MINGYLLKFTTLRSVINDHLIPWKKYLETNRNQHPDEELIRYQIGTIFNYNNNIKIVTPFFVHVPYSDCKLIEINTLQGYKLKLVKYCYFSRIAIYEFDCTFDKNNYDILTLSDINFKLDTINNNDIIIKTIEDDIIISRNNNIVFKNIKNPNIYPLIWIESNINNEDKIIPGTPVYDKTNILVGIVYNINDSFANIIPNITINKILSDDPLSNIYFDYHETDNPSNILINKIYSTSKNILIGDLICSVDDKPIKNGFVDFKTIDISIPLHTYLWYSTIKEHTFDIIRNYNYLRTTFKTEKLLDHIMPSNEIDTNYIIKDNMIFCELNLLLIEWLVQNEIKLKNITYLQYFETPFFKSKNNTFVT